MKNGLPSLRSACPLTVRPPGSVGRGAGSAGAGRRACGARLAAAGRPRRPRRPEGSSRRLGGLGMRGLCRMRCRGGSSACAGRAVAARSRHMSHARIEKNAIDCASSASRLRCIAARGRAGARADGARAARRHLRGLEGRLPDAAAKRLATFKAIGFQIVSFVPTYAYVGLDKIDLASGPDAGRAGRGGRGRAARRLQRRDQAAPRSARLPAGLRSVQVGQRQLARHVPVARLLRSRPDERRLPRGRRVRDAAACSRTRSTRGRRGGDAGAPGGRRRADELGRLHARALGSSCSAAAKKERHRLGLDGKVLLSHNFTHHIEIPDDFVGRMNAAAQEGARPATSAASTRCRCRSTWT